MQSWAPFWWSWLLLNLIYFKLITFLRLFLFLLIFSLNIENLLGLYAVNTKNFLFKFHKSFLLTFFIKQECFAFLQLFFGNATLKLGSCCPSCYDNQSCDVGNFNWIFPIVNSFVFSFHFQKKFLLRMRSKGNFAWFGLSIKPYLVENQILLVLRNSRWTCTFLFFIRDTWLSGWFLGHILLSIIFVA